MATERNQPARPRGSERGYQVGETVSRAIDAANTVARYLNPQQALSAQTSNLVAAAEPTLLNVAEGFMGVPMGYYSQTAPVAKSKPVAAAASTLPKTQKSPAAAPAATPRSTQDLVDAGVRQVLSGPYSLNMLQSAAGMLPMVAKSAVDPKSQMLADLLTIDRKLFEADKTAAKTPTEIANAYREQRNRLLESGGQDPTKNVMAALMALGLRDQQDD
jgi:hypothetical protein